MLIPSHSQCHDHMAEGLEFAQRHKDTQDQGAHSREGTKTGASVKMYQSSNSHFQVMV